MKGQLDGPEASIDESGAKQHDSTKKVASQKSTLAAAAAMSMSQCSWKEIGVEVLSRPRPDVMIERER